MVPSLSGRGLHSEDTDPERGRDPALAALLRHNRGAPHFISLFLLTLLINQSRQWVIIT